MPDYKQLPPQGSITIEEAISAGKRDITYAVRFILILSVVIAIILPAAGLSIWLLPVCIVFGMVSAFVYTIWMTPRWRIWAYSGVSDIHQFQRCAELDLLLPKQSPFMMTGIMSMEQRGTLIRLQQRFEDDTPFIDDPDVHQVSSIYGSLLSFDRNTPLIILTRDGIDTHAYGFYPWKDIWNEHVGTKAFAARGAYGYGMRGATSSKDYFCFICPALQVEIPMSSLDTTAGELDHMLYIHRGRYTQMMAGMPVAVPISGSASSQQ